MPFAPVYTLRILITGYHSRVVHMTPSGDVAKVGRAASRAGRANLAVRYYESLLRPEEDVRDLRGKRDVFDPRRYLNTPSDVATKSWVVSVHCKNGGRRSSRRNCPDVAYFEDAYRFTQEEILLTVMATHTRTGFWVGAHIPARDSQGRTVKAGQDMFNEGAWKVKKNGMVVYCSNIGAHAYPAHPPTDWLMQPAALIPESVLAMPRAWRNGYFCLEQTFIMNMVIVKITYKDFTPPDWLLATRPPRWAAYLPSWFRRMSVQTGRKVAINPRGLLVHPDLTFVSFARNQMWTLLRRVLKLAPWKVNSPKPYQLVPSKARVTTKMSIKPNSAFKADTIATLVDEVIEEFEPCVTMFPSLLEPLQNGTHGMFYGKDRERIVNMAVERRDQAISTDMSLRRARAAPYSLPEPASNAASWKIVGLLAVLGVVLRFFPGFVRKIMAIRAKLNPPAAKKLSVHSASLQTSILNALSSDGFSECVRTIVRAPIVEELDHALLLLVSTGFGLYPNNLISILTTTGARIVHAFGEVMQHVHTLSIAVFRTWSDDWWAGAGSSVVSSQVWEMNELNNVRAALPDPTTFTEKHKLEELQIQTTNKILEAYEATGHGKLSPTSRLTGALFMARIAGTTFHIRMAHYGRHKSWWQCILQHAKFNLLCELLARSGWDQLQLFNRHSHNYLFNQGTQALFLTAAALYLTQVDKEAFRSQDFSQTL